MTRNSNTREGKTVMVPKTEDLDHELPPYTTFLGDVGDDNGASSSGGKLRAFFIGMGFLPYHVDKVIEENGEENSETLLEALLRFSAHKTNCDSSDNLGSFRNTSRGRSAPNTYPDGHTKEAMRKSNSLSSDSLDSLFDDEDPPEISNVNQAKEDSDNSGLAPVCCIPCPLSEAMVTSSLLLRAGDAFTFSIQDEIKYEPDEVSGVIDDKRGSLLMMNFSMEEVEYAIHKLGMKMYIFSSTVTLWDQTSNRFVCLRAKASMGHLHSCSSLVDMSPLPCKDVQVVVALLSCDHNSETMAPSNLSLVVVGELAFLGTESMVVRKVGNGASIPDLVDFIFALQIAKKLKKEPEDISYYERVNEVSNEKLFGIMAKTLQLFEMGFSENEVSSAIDKLGSEVPISELANFIFAEQNGIDYVMEYKFPTTPAYSVGIKDEPDIDLCGTAEVKAENFSHGPPQSSHVIVEEIYNDNRVKEEEEIDEFPSNVSDQYLHLNLNFVENDRGKRPKYEHDDSISCLDPCLVEERVDSIVAELSKRPKLNPSRCLSNVAAKPPFFLFGNVSNISYDSWGKMSQFLYGIEPEFVNSQSFSALDRIEGYIHNLPVENRFLILPKPPMTIEEVIPRTKKWWPPWDSRKQLSSIYCETSGVAQTCDRLGKILADAGGVLTSKLQEDIIRYCRGLNLVWIGKFKLGPVEPEQLELILGYPINHTRAAGDNLAERLRSLKYCFQTDTLGYHLSVLKPIFPRGLTMLSLFSGIGGAEIALHRLDIKIKAVVSVETSAPNRKILERWWRQSGQTGTLVQIEDVQKLTSKKLEGLISKFGCFDLVIYQNPCSYSSSGLQAGVGLSALDFSVFCECVRVLQRVRDILKVLHLLRRYLGEYVHGLSSEALRISVWKGDVVLKDLKLKAEALNALKLPVTVKSGFVGTITLKFLTAVTMTAITVSSVIYESIVYSVVPWKSLGKEPVIVLIDRVFVLVHPVADSRSMKEEDRENLFEAKLQQIEEAESATLDAISKSKLGSTSSGNSWLSSLISTIIGNLKISISNVHIRYEDSVSNPGHPFSSGLTLAKVAAVTMDEQGNETFDTSGALDRLRKSVQLERLALYHDSDQLPWEIDKRWEDINPQEWIEIFEDGISEPTDDPKFVSKWAMNRAYLVYPMNAVLKYHRLGNQERVNPEIPFEKITLVLTDISLTLTEAQYHDWIKLLEAISRYKIYMGVSHLRPVVPISQAPCLWWQFAAQASLQQQQKCYRLSWDQIRHLCQCRRRYIQLYVAFLQQSSNVNCTEIREIEKDLDSKVILLWRLLAHAKVESVKSKVAAEERKMRKNSWFSFKWRDTEESPLDDASEEQELKEEWQAINKLLSYQPEEELMLRTSKDTQNMVQFLVTVSVGQAAARIISVNQKEIVCGRFEQLQVSTKLRHRSVYCDVLLKFYGLSAPEGSLTQSVYSEQKVNALVANFVHLPIGENIDWRLSATIAPCHVTVLMESIDRVMEFVKRSKAVSPTVALETATALQYSFLLLGYDSSHAVRSRWLSPRSLSENETSAPNPCLVLLRLGLHCNESGLQICDLVLQSCYCGLHLLWWHPTEPLFLLR
ncbi:unnamed protein product [Sphenostylis stenocarpa]|uniref:SAM-dependent MTase DRM-type domain-containing protein n=1 Tax=Sphenostylis stenocarpa TaxID=92480 RepID=A0AA86VJ12_9FABA|nr:unnamed protein product [Sphenostylis stenocarpa]